MTWPPFPRHIHDVLLLSAILSPWPTGRGESPHDVGPHVSMLAASLLRFASCEHPLLSPAKRWRELHAVKGRREEARASDTAYVRPSAFHDPSMIDDQRPAGSGQQAGAPGTA